MKLYNHFNSGSLHVLMPFAKRKLALIVIFLFSFLYWGNAQNAPGTTVSGKVTDSSGTGLAKVTVTERGTKNATITSEEGFFTIRVANSGSVLVFSSVGYIEKSVQVGSNSSINISLEASNEELKDVVVVGYTTRKKEALTGAIATITSKDMERVHGGSTVSSGLAGKLPGVSFRMADGRPGASANIQIRNLGNPLYVIDGVQQDGGQFNNLAPNDIESITVLKDGSAAVYGVRAANGVILVTTKKGKSGKPAINLDAFYGMQNWVRFPDVLNNSYDYMTYKADAEMNGRNRATAITPAELDRYKTGTELGYQSFDWRKFIIKPNAPLTSVNLNVRGGTDNVKYYISGTRLHQNSVLGREYKFDRTNIQSNLDANITKRLRVGVQINGRQEVRTNPGVPGGDDYFLPRFAILRNRPFERPYANDNPNYLNTIEQNDANWAFINYKNAGKFLQEWRVLQTNVEGEYKIPGIEGLSVKGMYSYYIADLLYNNQEYTYNTFTYRPATNTYDRTGGSINPWREKEQIKIINVTAQAQVNYNRTFGKHTVGALVANERITSQNRRNWIRSSPASNSLAFVYYAQLRDYQDGESREARVGYIARINYAYDNKYFLELFGRRDASHIFPTDKNVGYFPGVSVGWRLTNEKIMERVLGKIFNDFKLRASYGSMGDDGAVVPAALANFGYRPGYNYNVGTTIFNGDAFVVSRDRGVISRNYTWGQSYMTDIGADFTLLKGKLSGTFDWFYRKRTGLFASRNDIVLPSELGYTQPQENLESDATFGVEGSLLYNGKINRNMGFNVGANVTFARNKVLTRYKPVFGNSWDKYRNGQEGRLDPGRTIWGFEAIGQFQSVDEINNHPVNIDGEGNRTLLPGDLIYKDVNGDGRIDGLDVRPIGFGAGLPLLNFGLTLGLTYKNFDFSADFSGGAGFTWVQNSESRWAFQNGGNLNKIFTDRWHRADLFDLNSAWIPGKYPANRFNDNTLSSVNRVSTFWAQNVKYLRARTIQLGYTISPKFLTKARIQRAKVYINAFNLFSIDNVKKFGIDPEVADGNGLQFPQMKNVNFGINVTF